jgi:hypothetical protein
LTTRFYGNMKADLASVLLSISSLGRGYLLRTPKSQYSLSFTLLCFFGELQEKYNQSVFRNVSWRVASFIFEGGGRVLMAPTGVFSTIYSPTIVSFCTHSVVCTEVWLTWSHDKMGRTWWYLGRSDQVEPGYLHPFAIPHMYGTVHDFSMVRHECLRVMETIHILRVFGY